MMQEENESETKFRRVISLLVLAVILITAVVSSVSYAMGASTAQTFTVAETTLTSVTSIYPAQAPGQTVTERVGVPQPTTIYVTVAQTGPDIILLSGNAITKTVGTSPTKITFAMVGNGTLYPAIVQNGKYAVEVPNRANYVVYIDYGTTVANVASGQCPAGTLGAWFAYPPPEIDWGC